MEQFLKLSVFRTLYQKGFILFQMPGFGDGQTGCFQGIMKSIGNIFNVPEQLMGTVRISLGLVCQIN